MPLVAERERLLIETAAIIAADEPLIVERSWQPSEKQTPPEGDWDVWLLLGGRGSGKTRAGVEYVLEHLETYGEQARVGVGAPTIGAARSVCAEGESGLITKARERFTNYNRSTLEAWHVRGGYVKFEGAEEPGRWNGPQWSLLWADELALWRKESWEQALFGLRLPPRPRAIVTTTPKNQRWVRELSEAPGTVTRRMTTYENAANLAPAFIESVVSRYAGTRLGRQELLAEWVEDIPGALWQRAMIEDLRLSEAPEMARVVVAIDPAVTSGEDSDETGIIVAAKGVDGHGYVLSDLSCRLSPDGWARRAVGALGHFVGDRIIAEVNNGGDLVERVIRTVDPHAPYTAVHASRGKRVRAEPIAALYEQRKVHHVGTDLAELEDQMCAFTSDGYQGGGSPDRVDALVWALTELFEHGRAMCW